MPLLTINDLQNGDPKEIERLTAIGKKLSDHYEDFLAKDQGDGHTRAPGLHASEISGCARRAVYSLIGTERKDDVAPIWKKRFKVGHAIHKMLQDDFEKMVNTTHLHLSFEPEATIAPELQPVAALWNIQSHCDGVFVIRETWDGPEIARVLLEIKTEAPDSYEKLNSPRDSHLDQAHVYMKCLDVPFIWFLYWNKGNQNYTPSDHPRFFIKFDPKRWAKLEERFTGFHEAAKSGVLPDREEGMLCEFCAFSHVCAPEYLTRRDGRLPVLPQSWKTK